MIDLLKFLSMKDMVDGGGAGKAGPKFEGGGLLSEIANMLGKPLGWEDQLGETRPQARPDPIMSMPGFTPPAFLSPPEPHRSEPPVALPGQAWPPSPVTTTALPPAPTGVPSQVAMTELPYGQPPMPSGGEPSWQDRGVYSGRGDVGMPMPSHLTPDQAEALAWLRANNIRVN